MISQRTERDAAKVVVDIFSETIRDYPNNCVNLLSGVK